MRCPAGNVSFPVEHHHFWAFRQNRVRSGGKEFVSLGKYKGREGLQSSLRDYAMGLSQSQTSISSSLRGVVDLARFCGFL